MTDLLAFPIATLYPPAHPDRIQLYAAPTPNGVKASIMLEETGLPYEPHYVDIMKNATQAPDYLASNPNGKIPGILDPDGPGGKPMALFESGAILLYLAEKTGKFIPHDPTLRWESIQWVFFQMASIGPMFGQYNHFGVYAPEKIPYAIDRYLNESNRLLRVLDKRLSEAAYLAGEAYSIADIASFPWIRSMVTREILSLDATPSVARWYAAIGDRPAVMRGMAVMAEQQKPLTMSDETRDLLFGKGQTQQR